MEINKYYEVLTRYFNRLSQVGYAPDKETFSILVLTYIYDLNKEYTLTPEQTSIINNALCCLEGSCLIPYGSCKGTCM